MKNALIKSTTLGYAHGVLTAFLNLEYDDGGQGFGGFCLYNSKTTPKSQAGHYCGWWIDQVLKTVGVEEWEQLPGKHIRVDANYDKVNGIGHIIEGKWFYPKDDWQEQTIIEPPEDK